MNLHKGQDMTSNREKLLRFASNTDQLYGVRRMQMDEGKAKGSAIYEVHTSAGLSYDVHADNGLDIGRLTYRGINIVYFGKPGPVSPYSFSPFETEFINIFPGGMLYTCGLRNTGEPNRDTGEWQCEHGRYHWIPAKEISARVNDESGHIEISGKVREGQLFAHNLELFRRIASPVDSSEITIHDTLFNNTPETAEYMLLYHFNFGYPFLDPSLKLELPQSVKVTPAAEQSKGHEIDIRAEFTDPIDGYEERVFFHDLPKDEKTAKLKALNASLGIGAALSWTSDTLPHLIEWKSMRSSDYVLGLEPSTNHVIGRKKAREAGSLMSIPPFGRKEMQLKLEFFDL
jgi:hypothetical protein